MKKVYLLFVAVILAACSAEPVENEVLSGLDANLEGKNNKASAAALDPMGFYSGNSGNFKGTFNVWNDCDNLYFEITPTGDSPDDVQISLVDALPELNNGGQFKDLATDYSLNDADNLLWTIPVSEFDTESNLYIFVKAWGDDAGSSTIEESHHKYNDFIFDFSMCGDCDESFNYIQNEDGTYTFTYVPAEDMAGAELTFTFPQANAEFTVEGWDQSGNGNGQTWKKEMNLTACTTYEWTLKLTRICMGSTNNNNIWTDFKVNDDSKKGDLENITESCPNQVRIKEILKGPFSGPFFI